MRVSLLIAFTAILGASCVPIGDYRAIMIGNYKGQLRESRQALMSHLELCLLSDHNDILVSVDDVFLTPDGAIVIEHWTQEDNERLVAAVVEIGPGGIEFIRYFPSLDRVTEVLTANAFPVRRHIPPAIDIEASAAAVDQSSPGYVRGSPRS